MGRAEVQSAWELGSLVQWYYREGAFLVTPDLSHSAPVMALASKPPGPEAGLFMQCLGALVASSPEGLQLDRPGAGGSEGRSELPWEGQQRGRRGGGGERPPGASGGYSQPGLSWRLLPMVGLAAAPKAGRRGVGKGAPTEARLALQQLLLLCAGSTLARVLF